MNEAASVMDVGDVGSNASGLDRGQPCRKRNTAMDLLNSSLPPTNWLTRRPRSRLPSSGTSHSSNGTLQVGAGTLHPSCNPAIAAASEHEPRRPSAERRTELYVVNHETRRISESLAAGDSADAAHKPRDPQLEIISVEASSSYSRQSPSSNDVSRDFITPGESTSSSWPAQEEFQGSGEFTWQTVPVVEDATLHAIHKSQSARAQTVQHNLQNIKQENLGYHPKSLHPHKATHHLPVIPECHSFPNCNPNIKQEAPSEDHPQAVAAGAGAGKPTLFRFKGTAVSTQGMSIIRGLLNNKRGNMRKGRGGSRQRPAANTNIPDSTSSRYPHPYASGKVSKVNVCPVCEKFTVTELDRPADNNPNDEALRARFQCDLCKNVFDLGIPLFDPRGTPGVTLYQGEDRFTPPVPPRGSYPCPRCWMKTDTSFQCMTLYLREETRVPCQPDCPSDRLNYQFSAPISASAQPETSSSKSKNYLRKKFK